MVDNKLPERGHRPAATKAADLLSLKGILILYNFGEGLWKTCAPAGRVKKKLALPYISCLGNEGC